MSEVKHFHKKEAARILVELRNKTEDERLMDCRRQLLTKDNNMDGNQNSREFQERMEQACWPCPWPYSYSNLVLPPYHTVPIGYPTWPHNPQYRFSNSTAYLPEISTNQYIQAQLMAEYQANNFRSWAMAMGMLPQQQVDVDPGQSNRRRRTQFTDEQLAAFERTFTQISRTPSHEEIERLVLETGINRVKIKVWFQNRRAKERRIVGRQRISPALGLLFFSFAAPLTIVASFAGWLYRETNGYEKVFFVAGGTMVLSFLLLWPVHCLSKAPPDIHATNIRIVDDENAEQNIEMTNIPEGATEKNVLLPVSSGDLESDSLKVSCNGSNGTSDLDKIL